MRIFVKPEKKYIHFPTIAIKAHFYDYVLPPGVQKMPTVFSAIKIQRPTINIILTLCVPIEQGAQYTAALSNCGYQINVVGYIVSPNENRE